MELYDVLRTTFAAREFTNDPIPDDTVFKILDRARFAPSGGNRQGWRVIVVREQKTREALARLTTPAAKRYAAQLEARENPWNPIEQTSVDAARTPHRADPARGRRARRLRRPQGGRRDGPIPRAGGRRGRGIGVSVRVERPA